MPGQPDHTVTVHLGYGRTHAGRVGNGVGFNVYTLRSSAALWQASGIKVNVADRLLIDLNATVALDSGVTLKFTNGGGPTQFAANERWELSAHRS